MTLVSIVIPHFNRSQLLEETLNSVRLQTSDKWEVIIVDDGSDAAEFASVVRLQDQRVRVMRRLDGLKGPSRCRNLGAAAAAGDFLIFLDSDDLLAPWCLQQRTSCMQQSPEADAVVLPVALFHSQPGDSTDLWNELGGEDDVQRFVISDPVWHTSSPLWRRESFLRIGGFDERVMYGDDSELHMRALLLGVRFVKHLEQLPDVFVRRTEQPRITNQLTKQLVDSRLSRLRVCANLLQKHGDRRLQRAWQSQYVAECEFLVYSMRAGDDLIEAVLAEWLTTWQEYHRLQWLTSLYIRSAAAAARRNSLLWRIVRKLTRSLCPRILFPRLRWGGARMTQDALSLMKNRLQQHTRASTVAIFAKTYTGR